MAEEAEAKRIAEEEAAKVLQEQEQNGQVEEEKKDEFTAPVEQPMKKRAMSKNEKKKWRDKKNKMLKKIKDEINDDEAEMT